MSKFIKYNLADLYDLASGISSKPEQAGHGYPFCSFSTVFNNAVLPNELPDLMDTSEEERVTYSIKEGDVFLTRTSETVDELGMSSVAVKDYPDATYSGFLKRLRPKTNLTYPKYMAMFFRSNYFRKTVANKAVMTLRASFNEDIFNDIVVELPSMPEQIKIGDLFFCIEQKIRVNNSICSDLEEMAKQIYDYWFVQFDFPDENGKPYKSSGGKMEWNEALKREIPKEWSAGALSDVIEKVTNGVSAKEIVDLPYTPMDILPMRKMSFSEVGSQDDAKSSLIKYSKYSILFGAMRPYFHRVCIAPFDGITRTTVFTLREKNAGELGYAYMTINQDYAVDYATLHHVGTQQPYAEWDSNLENCPIPLPTRDIRLLYSRTIQSMIDNIIALNLENRRLTELRDFLLPMLMNGQIKIEA